MVHPLIDISGKTKKGGQSCGHIEIIIHGRYKALFKGINDLIEVRVHRGRFCEIYFLNKFIKMGNGVSDGSKLGMGKEDRFPIVTTEQPVSNFSSSGSFCQDIPQGQIDIIGCIGTIEHDRFIVKPVIGKRPVRGGLADGDGVFVVGKCQGHAAGVDIMGGPQGFQRNGGTLKMPSRAYISPFCFKEKAGFQFAEGRSFEQGKILGVFFLILVQINCFTDSDFIKINIGKFPVILESGDIKIYGP